MNDTNHLEAFKAFVAAQDPEQVITHTEGYKHCAIGAYGQTIGVVDDFPLCEIANDIIGELYHTEGRHIGSIINVPAISEQQIPTYGKLSELLDIWKQNG